MGVIWFNGVSSRDHGLIVEAYPASVHAPKRGEAYQIAGRNGTFYSEDGTYDNYTQPYQVAIWEGQRRRADLRCAEIAAWLTNPGGFCRLEDSFEPEVYRLARFAGPLNIEQIMGRVGRTQLEFECLPERWLLSGEQAHNIKATPSIFNPTEKTARPLLTLTATGDVDITLNGSTVMTVPGGSASHSVIIDCDARTITDGAGNSLSNSTIFYTTYHEFPALSPGLSTFTVDSNISAFECVPRWWTV